MEVAQITTIVFAILYCIEVVKNIKLRSLVKYISQRTLAEMKDQKLKEIKELAEELIPLTEEYDNCYYKDKCNTCKHARDCQYNKVEKILNAIEGNY